MYRNQFTEIVDTKETYFVKSLKKYEEKNYLFVIGSENIKGLSAPRSSCEIHLLSSTALKSAGAKVSSRCLSLNSSGEENAKANTRSDLPSRCPFLNVIQISDSTSTS